jgi:hypothetical protein
MGGPGDFGLESTQASLSTAQAGAHPDFETRFQIAGNPVLETEGQDPPWENLRDLPIELPAGLIGNPNAFPTCSAAVFVEQLDMLGNSNHPACPSDSQVGIISPGLLGLLSFPPGAYRAPLYNLERPSGNQHVVARFGGIALFEPLFIDLRLDPKRDNALTASLVNAPAAGITGAHTVIWGLPADKSHDDERFDWLEAISCNGPCSGPVPSRLSPAAALMSNPTSCGPTDVGTGAISYVDSEGGDYGFAPLSISGCEHVPFAPTLSIAPTTRSAGAASGLDVKLHLPQETFTNPQGLRTADLRKVEVTLPKGISIDPSVADGLASCTKDEVGFDSNERQLTNVGARGAPVTLGFDGQTTADLPGLASAQEVQAALVALQNVREGDVAVAGRRGGPWQVDFAGSLTGRDVPTITGVLSEVQRLAIKADGGTYTLGFDGKETESLSFDADAVTVQTALEALPGVGPGDVTVTGGHVENGAVFRIVFGGSLIRTDVPEIETTSSLTGSGSFVKVYALAEGGSAASVRTIAQGGGLRFNDRTVHCPEGSKIAGGEVTTPLLPGPLPASIYVTSRTDNPFDSGFGAYLVVAGDGVVFKVAGRLEIEPDSGRLVVLFENMPQLPIADLILRFKGGIRGVVTTPRECGSYQSKWELTPWSTGTPTKGTSEFVIDEGCTDRTPLGFDAGSSSALGGSFTSFATDFRRSARSPSLTGVAVSAPPGLTAKIAGVARCSEAAITALAGSAGPTEGREIGASCPDSSQIGTVTMGVGSGSPFYPSTGKAFLAGPYKAAPLSMVVVAPALAGPFDLGQAVVRAALYIDPETAQIRAVSDPLPTMLEGVPLEIRDLRVNVDRAGFATNPTSCREKSVTGTIEQADGVASDVSDRFQVGSCADLGFKPRVRFRLSGGIHRNGHPAINIEIAPGAADANISSVVFTLPTGELLDAHRLPALCSHDVSPEGCPGSSELGQGRLWSPLLDAPLEGSIYLRTPTGRLPDLLVDLRQSKFHVVIHGHTIATDGHLRVRFPALPDIPISRAIFTLAGGRRGIFVNSETLCGRSPRGMVALKAHNGKQRRLLPKVSLHGRC